MKLKILIIISTIFALLSNFLAVALPLNGKSTQFLSDQYPTLFTPAGYVFSIWGLIYIGIVYFMYRVYLDNKNSYTNVLLFTLSNFLNGIWIFFWHYESILFSLVTMFSLLGALILLYLNIKGKDLLYRLPISIYLGWISVATIANASVYLYVQEWSGFNISNSVWAIILSIIATFLACIMLWRENDWAFPSVIVWSFVGLIIKFKEIEQSYIYFLIAESILISAWLLYYILKRKVIYKK